MNQDKYSPNELIAKAIGRKFRTNETSQHVPSIIYKVEDIELLINNIAHSSLRTSDPEIRSYLEAKICLLARASAGGAEESVVDGNVTIEGSSRYFMANLYFGEIVVECGEKSFVAVKPGED